jgi:hypothetical protein
MQSCFSVVDFRLWRMKSLAIWLVFEPYLTVISPVLGPYSWPIPANNAKSTISESHCPPYT